MEQDPKQDQTNVPAVQIERRTIVPLMDLGTIKANRNLISTNFNGEGYAAAKFITDALASDSLRLDEASNTVFPTRYYLAHVCDYVAEDGEVLTMPRVVLIGPAGETMAFVSEGAIRSLDLIRTLLGDGPWNPPLPIRVQPVPTRHGFRTFRFALGDSPSGTTSPPVRRRRSQQTTQEGDTEISDRQQG